MGKKKISVWFRIPIVASVFWFAYWFIDAISKQWVEDKLYTAVFPILLLWGIIWIILGFRKNKQQ